MENRLDFYKHREGVKPLPLFKRRDIFKSSPLSLLRRLNKVTEKHELEKV